MFAESFACGVYHQIIHAQAHYYIDGIAIFEENVVDTMRTQYRLYWILQICMKCLPTGQQFVCLSNLINIFVAEMYVAFGSQYSSISKFVIH